MSRFLDDVIMGAIAASIIVGLGLDSCSCSSPLQAQSRPAAPVAEPGDLEDVARCLVAENVPGTDWDAILDVLEQTGGKATIFPNGVYASSWEPQAARIRKLVASRQLTLGNHTYSHQVSTQIGPEAFGADLQRNEDWIQETFKLTGRPWFRPPYGDRNPSIDDAAGQRGYRKVIMWSGTVADSDPRSEAYILNAIDYWAKPGAIILMHANYPATGKALPKIFRMLEKRRLEPVTLAELLGSS